MTKSASVPALLLLLLGVTCVVHVTTAQPTPAGEGQRAVERTLDEDYSELDGQPLIEFKEGDHEEKFINSRLIDLSNAIGFLWFSWHVLRPEDMIVDLNDLTYGRGFGDGSKTNHTDVDKDFDEKIFSHSYEVAMNSLDPVGASLEYMGVRDPHCKQRMMCAARRAMASFSVTESAAQRFGWLLGSLPKYEDALRHGRQLHDCLEHYSECPSLPLPFL